MIACNGMSEVSHDLRAAIMALCLQPRTIMAALRPTPRPYYYIYDDYNTLCLFTLLVN